MMKKEVCIDSASLNRDQTLKYKTLAVAFSYPDDNFFNLFPSVSSGREKDRIITEYDRLFRTNQICLYGGEHFCGNEFERAHYLADIMGFYKAFGLEPDRDRPDALSCELEFMHYLMTKALRTTEKDKADICREASRKFFNEYLYPSAQKIAQVIVSQANNDFYIQMSEEMLEFLSAENDRFRENS